MANNTGNILTALEKVYQRYPALVPAMPFKDNVAPKKVKGGKVIHTDQGRMLVWLTKDTKDQMQRAVRYVVYRFAKGERINLDNPANIAAITSQTFWPLPDGEQGYTYVVTALDRMWNESKGKKVKN